ncbi:MAG: type I restriction-modification system subunit M N-terminal domain-containing protein [Candidatus Helarchaeota archaeon]|nr:type I restriction-modification system subunit M N-terminal domain-containing protein [Candidatus Helarchaeota archaeon]
MAQQISFPEKITREKINSLIDRAADLIRTAVDYKFILVLLFLKRLNDVWENEKQQVKERLTKKVGLAEKEAEEEARKEDYYTFYIPKRFLWGLFMNRACSLINVQ